MNLATLSLILGSIASVFAILAYLYKGMRFNKARSKAQQGRIVALVQVLRFQWERLKVVETHLSKEDASDFQVNDSLIKLEEEAMSDYKKHDTNLT